MCASTLLERKKTSLAPQQELRSYPGGSVQLNAETASGESVSLPRGKHSKSVSRTADGRLDGGLVGLRPWPEWHDEEPNLDPSMRIGLVQIAGEAQARSPYDRRDAPGVDVLRAHSDPAQDRTITVPIPRLIDEAATGSVTGDAQFAGLRAPLSHSAPVRDVPGLRGGALSHVRAVTTSPEAVPERCHEEPDLGPSTPTRSGAHRRRSSDGLAGPPPKRGAGRARPGPNHDRAYAPAHRRGGRGWRDGRHVGGQPGGSAVDLRAGADVAAPVELHRAGTSANDGAEKSGHDGQEVGYRAPGRIVVLIPAHNEAQSIAQTIQSLYKQTMPPDEITVICDNCTDNTELLGFLHGARVFTTTGNTSKKAGALNQALRVSLPHLTDDDLVLTIDADSKLNTDWIRNAWLELCSTHARQAGAVCGIVKGENSHGLIGQLQRNEYIRAARNIARMRRIWVLSGCGTIFRASALRTVASERGASLPGRYGDCFNTASVTEDYEMTLALKVLGFDCLCSIDSVATTELMPTWRELFGQRLRWQRGSLEDLRRFGILRATWLDWCRQAISHISYAVLIMCWTVNLSALITRTPFNPRWGLGALLVYLIESMWTVRKAGYRGMILALWILPEFGYTIFRSLYLASALKHQFTQRRAVWGHGARDIT